MVDERTADLPFNDHFPVQVQITILSSGSEYEAYVSADQGRFHRFRIGLKPHDIEELNTELQQAIEQVSHDVETNGISGDSLLRLAQTGNFAFKQIFTEGIPRETVRKALKTNAIIQLVGSDFFLPWEFLYESDDPPEAPVDISRFWGMQYIVSRALIQDARPGDLVSPIIHSSRPHVGLIACNELEHVVKREIPSLRKLHGSKQIRLSLLGSLKASQRDKELTRFGGFLGKKLQIVHLACHAHEKKPISQSFLLVSDEFNISIEDFVVQNFAIKHNPFVILNACLTGTINPLYTSNWAALFWGRGARGVLATEFHVPDWFAAAFTGELYKHLLSGRPIGEAVLATRCYFWKEHGNPLGLAYALYSSPSIRIVNSN